MKTFVALIGAIVFAAPGSATPRLGIGQVSILASPTAVGVGYSQAEGDPAPSRITIDVPSAYEFTPHADGASPGTTIGFDEVQVTPPFGEYPATGLITMEDPRAFAEEGIACIGSPSSDAVWAAHIGSTHGVIAIPIFVEGRSLTFCPDASMLGGSPTLISFQLGLLSSSGASHSLLTGPKTRGRFVWTATVERRGMPNVEIRSVVDLPQRATFTAKIVRSAVRISGRVTANGRGVSGVRVQADAVKRRSRGFEAVFHARTRSDGRFTIIHRIRHGTLYVRVRAYRDDVTTNSCTGPSSAPGGCVSTTWNGFGLKATPAAIRVHS